MFINPISQEIGLGDRPRRQETTLGSADAHTRLLKKVKRLEKIQRARTLGMKLVKIGTSKKKTLDKEYVSKQGRDESKEAKELNLSNKESGENKVFDYTTAVENDVNAAEPDYIVGDAVNAASVVPDVSFAGPFTSTARDIFKDEMITMVDILMAIRRTRSRTTSVVIHDVEEEPRKATPPLTVQSQDKEREKFTIDEQARMLVDLIAEIKRFFAAQRAEQIRNKPTTKAQLKNKMVTYLKHMGKYTHNQLKSNSFEEIQMLYEREQKWINEFVPMDSEEVNDSEQQVEGSKKRSRVDHDKENVKKQKLEEEDVEKEELRACLDILSVDDIAIDVESLATKYPIIRYNGSVQAGKRKEMLEKMLNWKLEAEAESTMAFELLKFIKSHIEE
nr:hypothetical protein [Tanacetum cinerariifolium]